MSVEQLAARAASTLNMSWHNPDLYFFLCLLAGIAALLAIIYECIQKFCSRKPEQGDAPVYLEKAKPLDDLRLQAAGKRDAERFSQLCESTKDLPAKEQVSRVREHFGIFGGVRPHRRNERAAPVYLKNVKPLGGLLRDPPD